MRYRRIRHLRRPAQPFTLALCAALLASVALAQGDGSAARPSPSHSPSGARLPANPQERAQRPFRADVDMVLVDCVVLDESGEFVHDLTLDDFRVFEEGEPVEISVFSEQHYGGGTSARIAATPAGAEEPVAEETADHVVGLPRYIVIFVDAVNTAPNEWDRLRPALTEFVRTALSPNDRVLVAMLTPDARLRVAPEFTSSSGVIESTLSYISGNPEIRERVRQNEQRLLESLRAEEADPGGGVPDAAGEATALHMGSTLAGFFALERRDQVLHTLDTLTSLAEHLDRTHDIAGPKTLLFVSGGLPEQPGSNYYYILDEYQQQANPAVQGQAGIGGYNPSMSRSGGNSIQDRLTSAIGKLNRLNYTVYTIDARGAADFAGDSPATRSRTPISPEARTQIFQDAQSGLGAISRGTGGLSFTGTNNFAGAIADIHADTAYRYVLGYVPPAHEPEDVEEGKFFRLRVEVDIPGVRVRAREGYVDR